MVVGVTYTTGAQTAKRRTLMPSESVRLSQAVSRENGLNDLKLVSCQQGKMSCLERLFYKVLLLVYEEGMHSDISDYEQLSRPRLQKK